MTTIKCVRPSGMYCNSYSRKGVSDHCKDCTWGEIIGDLRPGNIIHVEKTVASTPRYGHPMFYEILDELCDLHSRKNHDYAGDDPLSNLKMCERGGLPGWEGAVVRLTDKISRLLTFMKKGEFQVKDESVEDTFKDAAIYSILGLVLYRESKQNAK